MGGYEHGGGDMARGSTGPRGTPARTWWLGDGVVDGAGAQRGEEEEGAPVREETEGATAAQARCEEGEAREWRSGRVVLQRDHGAHALTRGRRQWRSQGMDLREEARRPDVNNSGVSGRGTEEERVIEAT